MPTLIDQFQVGEFVVEPQLNRVSLEEHSQQVEPKVMEVLVYLAEHPGEVLSKDRIIQAVWRDTFVTDEALWHCIAELRRVFEDDARNPRFIQTIAKKGYRLIADVARPEPAASGSWMKWATGLLGAVALVAVLYFFGLYETESVPIHTERNSIAVLPFDNLSAEPEDEYFSDGVTEEIISQLAKIRDLKVISRKSSMQYRDSTKDLRQIGAELGVSTILQGSVRRDKERVRISAQLIDTAADQHLWADTYNRGLADIFAVQSDVALQIADALETNLTAHEKEDIQEKPTESTEAYDYYLRGLSYSQRSTLRKDFLLAIQMLDEAITLDPDFALAHALLAQMHSRMYWRFYDRTEDRMAKAKAAAGQALQLNPQLPEAHWALGSYYLWCHSDYDRALEEFAIAQAGRPNDSSVSLGIGLVRGAQGNWEEAIANLRRAVELDPKPGVASFQLAFTYIAMRRWAEAEEHIDRAISLSPEHTLAYGVKAWLCLESEGNIEKARTVLQPLRDLGLVEDDFTAWLAIMIEICDGNYQEALDRLSTSRREAFDTPFLYVPKELVCPVSNRC